MKYYENYVLNLNVFGHIRTPFYSCWRQDYSMRWIWISFRVIWIYLTELEMGRFIFSYSSNDLPEALIMLR